MSGGGGGGGDDDWRPKPMPTTKPKTGGEGDGGGIQSIPDACNIVETTQLNSPDPKVLASIHVRDLLDVIFQPGPPKRLVAATKNGAIAGSITSQSMPQIIQCISQGVVYVAEVVVLRGAVCQVKVRPA